MTSACQGRSGARKEAPAPADPPEEKDAEKRKEEKGRAARGTHATQKRTAQTEQEANTTKTKTKI